MVVLPQYKALFISQPRCATHSMFDLLCRAYGGKRATGPNRTFHRRKKPEGTEDWLCFTVCRNPYSRAVSFWSQAINTHWERLKGKLASREFIDFARWLANTDHDMLWPVSMHNWHAGIRIHLTLRLETLERDAQWLPFHDSGAPIHQLNALEQDRKPWREYYTDESAALVRRWAGSDFDIYGYEQVAPT